MGAAANPFPVGTRVIWTEEEKDTGLDFEWSGVVTAVPFGQSVIVKLDAGGAFRVPTSDLRKADG